MLFLEAVVAWVRERPASLYGLAVAVVALVAEFGVNVPQDGILAVVGAVLAVVAGAAVQRTEDRKTERGF